MSIETAEQLKRELTDKYVVVADGVQELRRFAGLTGIVKTVNMNCQVLVQFLGREDIGWYDIAPAYLRVVDAPLKTEKKAHAEPKAAEKPKPAAKPAASTGEQKLSPLEMARQQAAGATAKPAAGEKKLSPLEMARQQGASGAAKPAAPAGEKKLSPLEMARQQGAGGATAKPAQAKPPEKPPVPEPVVEPEPPAAPVAKASAAPKGGPVNLTTEQILVLAREQGAVKQ